MDDFELKLEGSRLTPASRKEVERAIARVFNYGESVWMYVGKTDYIAVKAVTADNSLTQFAVFVDSCVGDGIRKTPFGAVKLIERFANAMADKLARQGFTTWKETMEGYFERV